MEKIPDFSQILCLDLEASGFGAESYPIEVGVVSVSTRQAQSWLLKPPEVWLKHGYWSVDSEKVHGLSQKILEAEGQDLEKVAAALIRVCSGRLVLSDARKYDCAWLQRLWDVLGYKDAPFEVDSFHDVAAYMAQSAFSDPEAALERARDAAEKRFPHRHRAEVDAQRNAEILCFLNENKSEA